VKRGSSTVETHTRLETAETTIDSFGSETACREKKKDSEFRQKRRDQNVTKGGGMKGKEERPTGPVEGGLG